MLALLTIVTQTITVLAVCGKILDATISVMSASDVPLETLLHFISSFPQDFLNYGGKHT